MHGTMTMGNTILVVRMIGVEKARVPLQYQRLAASDIVDKQDESLQRGSVGRFQKAVDPVNSPPTRALLSTLSRSQT